MLSQRRASASAVAIAIASDNPGLGSRLLCRLLCPTQLEELLLTLSPGLAALPFRANASCVD